MKARIPRWLFLVVELGLFSGLVFLALRWAMLPGYWAGSWLDSPDKPLLTVVQERFGPILIQRAWIKDPEGTWGARQDVLQMWGSLETVYRLVLLVGVLWLVLCVVVAIKTKRHYAPPLA